MTKIKKIPAPEDFECLWCKKKIAAGSQSLAVEVDGTRLFFCAECGRGVQETRRPPAKDKVLQSLVSDEYRTVREVSERSSVSNGATWKALTELCDDGLAERIAQREGERTWHSYRLKKSTLRSQGYPETTKHPSKKF
jgi:ribosomal protein L24E